MSEDKNIKVIYIIGIEGAGTSALALMLKKKGYVVFGSDSGDHFYGDILQKMNIKVFDKYSSGNIPNDVDMIIYSTSIKNDNPELIEAKNRELPLYSYPEALALLFNEKVGIAICGTHGKTTTSAMLAYVLDSVGLDPDAIIGSKVVDWGENTLSGSGEYFVIEADEYQNKLKLYNPWSVILTSIDYDHPDFYKSFEEYKKAFFEFVKKIPSHGFLFFCNDDRDVLSVAKKANCRKISYGFSDDSDYSINNFKISKTDKSVFCQSFDAYCGDDFMGKFTTKLVGKHNALNALAVIAFCHKLGLNIEKVKDNLKKFSGTSRRFEYIGKSRGAILIDDYAHHPKEIKVVLKTLRDIYSNKKIIVVFHPHSFSRTKLLLEEFSQSFSDATTVVVLDIYGSVREESGEVNSEDLVKKINKYSLKNKAFHISNMEKAIYFLRDKLDKNTVIVSMGAGDVWKLTHKLAKTK